MDINKLYLPVLLLVIFICSSLLQTAVAQTDEHAEIVKSVNYENDSTQKRPIPYPVIRSPQFKEAIRKGTRTTSGKPGPDYWTNTASYKLHASLSPETKTLRGDGTIRYTNNSPDTLSKLVIHLRQNFYRKGNIRNRHTAITGGMEISKVRLNGKPLIEHKESSQSSGYQIRSTLMQVYPESDIAPGETVTLEIAWNFKIPPAHGSRMGQDGEVFYLGYWYPQVAVYDDVSGWVAQPYMGDGEFYMGYGSYDVQITVPQGWLVGATGQLHNSEDVLTSTVQNRIKKAKTTDSVISVVDMGERKAGLSTRQSENGSLTWHFKADRVRDFAFGTSDQYVWDATSVSTGDGRSLIHSFYRPRFETWENAAEFGQFAVKDLSRTFMPYPWPQMTIVEGILGGGMEYPMITLIGSNKSKKGLFGTIYHEVSHMWFPMIVGTNEKAYTWMDEGLVTFNTQEGKKAYWPDAKPWAPGESSYYYIAGSGYEIPSMRHGDRYPVYSPARGLASYSKPALMLHTLRGILGEEAFMKAYKAYSERWAYKHPYPYDLFNTFEDVLNRDLDWFWTPAFYETWTADPSIQKVSTSGNQARVIIKDKGLFPLPIVVQATYEDGSTKKQKIPVSTWLSGKRKEVIQFDANNLTSVEIDPEHYLPDTDRSNNIWKQN